MTQNVHFWELLDRLVSENPLRIDRPKGSRHPHYPEMIYPVDYGYLEGTHSMDGGGIDVWRGTAQNRGVVAVIASIDHKKMDAEIKVLLDCSPSEQQTIANFHNHSPEMQGILLPRPEEI